jgi:hypothetical protein
LIKAWDSKIEANSAFYSLNDDGANAIYNFIKKSKICQSYTSILKIQELMVNEDLSDELGPDIKSIKSILNESYGFVILEPIHGLNIFEQAVVPWFIAQAMGEIPGQNYNDDKIYIVNDVGGKMEGGYRYSRTNQGGSIHTDGVNVKKPFDYFLLHMISQGLFGGESIIVNGLIVYNYLKKNIPEVINILTKNFLWEYKGVKKNKYYREPILKLVNNIPMWRYLRNYIEEASVKKKEALSSEKIWAMDCLDSILESSDFQFRYRLNKGETIFINDRNIFHGRRPYVDAIRSKYFSDINKSRVTDVNLRRTGLRIWINS